jgi:aminoglycoside 2'-N-acetyltransferase I
VGRSRTRSGASVRIETHPEASVPLALRSQVVRLQDQAWPPDHPSGTAAWHDSLLAPVSMVMVVDDRVVAALDVLRKELDHAGERWAASGLSTVVTDEALRRHGYGTRLVLAAKAHIEASGADLCLFTCDPELLGFYERAGWEQLPGTVVVGGTREVPYPSDALGKVTLGAFFTARAEAARDAFIGARVGLYPGIIDLLW